MLKQHLQYRVTSFVIRSGNALLLFDLARLVCATPTHFVARFFEIGEFDEILVRHRGDDRGFIDERGEICA